MFEYTSKLLEALDAPDFKPRGPPDDPVLRYGERTLVRRIYAEHVDAQMNEEETPPRALRWLRSLEDAQPMKDRLFRTSGYHDEEWWARHVLQVCRYESHKPRIALPLEEDIQVVVEALQPLFIRWAYHDDPDSPPLYDVSMFPFVLLRWTSQSLDDRETFKKAIAKARALPRRRAEKPQYPTKHSSNSPAIKMVLEGTAEWPGLRAYAPFHMDVSALQDPPASALQKSQWVALHALGKKGDFVAASITIRGDRAVDCAVASPRERWPGQEQHRSSMRIALLVGMDAASDEIIAKILDGLDQWTPCGGKDDDRMARAAALLLPPYDAKLVDLRPRPPHAAAAGCPAMATAAGGQDASVLPLFLPERPFDRVEPDFTRDWRRKQQGGTKEPLYEVHFQGRTYRLSSYVGFGLRLRLQMLGLGLGLRPNAGRGVCVVVPDNTREPAAGVRVENAARCCLRGLVDTERGVRVLSEHQCVGGALVREANGQQGVWACVHDGPGLAVAQAWRVTGRHDPRQDVLRKAESAYQVFMQQAYAYVLNGAEVGELLADSSEAVGATLRRVVEGLPGAMPGAVAQMDELVSASEVTVTMTLGTTLGGLDVCFKRRDVQGWVDKALGFAEDIARGARGVFVSGGLFDKLPDLGRARLAACLEVHEDHVRPLKTHPLKAALMHVYGSQNGPALTFLENETA